MADCMRTSPFDGPSGVLMINEQDPSGSVSGLDEHFSAKLGKLSEQPCG